MNHNPAITVLMTIYKDKEYLAEAIASILNQTYRNFEFLIIAEPETPDESLEMIRAFHDKRIRLVINKKHLGFSNSLNKGIKIARGKYIARMDADDISLRNRLLVQFIYMELHSNVILCGTNVYDINAKGEKIEKTHLPLCSKKIKMWLCFRNVIRHPTVMFRRDKIIADNFFYKVQEAEDYELWTRICLQYRITNLRSVLLKRRLHHDNSIYVKGKEILEYDVQTQKKLWEGMGIQVDITKPFYENRELTLKERKQRREYINRLEYKVPYFVGKKRMFRSIKQDFR